MWQSLHHEENKQSSIKGGPSAVFAEGPFWHTFIYVIIWTAF